MKKTQRISLALSVVLAATIVITACEQESDLVSQNFSSAPLFNSNEPGSTSISNGLLKDELDHYAFEAYKRFYKIELSFENSRLIDSKTLSAWINANEKNKHPEINRLNRKALANMKNPVALLIQAPVGSPFNQSVFILGNSSALIVTDIHLVDKTIGPRFHIVKEGLGFYGEGYLDSFGNHLCTPCIEEYKIISVGANYLRCGPCSYQDNPLNPPTDPQLLK